jgi:hypothetical protein
VWLELVEALLAEPLLVAGDQRRHLELGRILVTLVARARRRREPIDRTRRDVLLGIVILGLPTTAEDREEHGVESVDLSGIRDEHRAGRPVQPPT